MGGGNEMFFTFTGVYIDHNIQEDENKEIRVIVTGTGEGLAISQL